jgi:integrase
MLAVYPRHIATCESKLKAKGLSAKERRTWRRCGCPLWIIGKDPHDVYHRHTLDTTSWAVAEEKKRKIELGVPDQPLIRIEEAAEAWKNALLAAKREPRTVQQVHGAMTASLTAWSQHQGYMLLHELTPPVLDAFVRCWDYASTTHRARIDLMRSFFKFCMARKWITENPAAVLIKPEEDLEPTLPFTVEEEARIFAAAARFHERPHFGGLWASHPETAFALLQVLRWTGLRASDSVLFEPRDLDCQTFDGREVAVYRTYQTKTGEHVLCPIPPEIAASIKSAPRLSAAHAFIPPADGKWNTDARSVSNGFYTNYLCPLGVLAEVKEVRAHRFRDTFAVRLLEQGKPLEIVSMLLGHRSIRTTEKHYAPWVRSRAEMLIREVVSTWH